jgi:hypothetical protein
MVTWKGKRHITTIMSSTLNLKEGREHRCGGFYPRLYHEENTFK